MQGHEADCRGPGGAMSAGTFAIVVEDEESFRMREVALTTAAATPGGPDDEDKRENEFCLGTTDELAKSSRGTKLAEEPRGVKRTMTGEAGGRHDWMLADVPMLI